MSSKRILFQFFRDQAESDSDKGREGGRTEGGGEGVDHISVKIIIFACI